MLNKRLLLEALLPQPEHVENAFIGKSEITDIGIVQEKVHAGRRKAPFLKVALVVGFVLTLTAASYFISSYLSGARRTGLTLTWLQGKEPPEKRIPLNAEAEKAAGEPATTDLRREAATPIPATTEAQQAQGAVAAPPGAQAETAQTPPEQERLKNRLPDVSLQAEKGREARLRPEEAIAPRKLTANQQSLLAGLLRVNPGQVAIAVRGNDDEAWNFAQNIREALQGAGWTIQEVNQSMVADIPAGLTIVVPSAEFRPPHAGLLRMSLNDIGFNTGWSIDQNVQPGAILLLVGANHK